MAARHWIGTISVASNWTPPDTLQTPCVWVKGQREIGEGGFEHYQLIASFSRPVRLRQVKGCFEPTGHWEATRSAAAEAYVWKEDTRVAGSQFTIGTRPLNRNSAKDWDAIWDAAKSGDFTNIPADVKGIILLILVRCYGNLQKIARDHTLPVAVERVVSVFWGRTGTGKSRRAWEEAGLDAYPKVLLFNIRLPQRSGGTDIDNIIMSLWMNSEEKLELDTCYGGSTGTRYVLKQREVRAFSRLLRFGLRAILAQNNGFLP